MGSVVQNDDKSGRYGAGCRRTGAGETGRIGHMRRTRLTRWTRRRRRTRLRLTGLRSAAAVLTLAAVATGCAGGGAGTGGAGKGIRPAPGQQPGRVLRQIPAQVVAGVRAPVAEEGGGDLG